MTNQSELQQPVGKFSFGGNTISADQTGTFLIHFVHGGDWKFDLGEIGRLDVVLADFEAIKRGKHVRVFWRTNGTRIIQVEIDIEGSLEVKLYEVGCRNTYFLRREIPGLRRSIHHLTSEGAPYGRSMRLINVVEDERAEEIATIQQIPLDNRNSLSSLIVEREFTRETAKSIVVGTSYGVGLDYYVNLNLESHFSISQQNRITERVMVRMEARAGEYKVYRIVWKEVWIIGRATFELGSQDVEVPFRLKSGLEPDISQETIGSQN